MLLKDKIKDITAIITAIGTLITTLLNQKYLKGIFDFLGEEKEYVIIIIVVLLLLIVSLLLYRILRNNINLKNHTFFTQMEFYIGYNINNLESELTESRVVFTDYLKIKFEFWRAHCKFLVDEYYKGNIKNNEYYKTWFMDALKEQQIIMVKNNIPPIIIKIVNKWHKRRISSTLNFISKITQSNSKNSYTINALLTFLDNAFDDTILDAETSIYTLNGDICNIEYHRIIDNKNEIIIL